LIAARAQFVSDKPVFIPPGSTAEVEEGRIFSPKFDAAGLITCVVVDAPTNELLMVAHMNAAALARTIETGDAWFYSRSRATLWRKGETSGHVQHVIEMRVDCDQDALLLRVEQTGEGACHTGRRSCFYRSLNLAQPADGPVALTFVNANKVFDPDEVYGKPTKR
jgi:phosphoribosyl-AMP cyclohydrolase